MPSLYSSLKHGFNIIIKQAVICYKPLQKCKVHQSVGFIVVL